MTRGGLSRQVSVDELIFENDSTLQQVSPGSKGPGKSIQSNVPSNLALHAKASASSFYQLESLEYDYAYLPSYATDGYNATMWKAGDNSFPQSLTIDLETQTHVKRIMTQFEFAGYYYQYTLEYSLDGKNWEVFADRSKNRISGSPMTDDADVKARYIKLTVLDTEKTGLLAAVWNIKVFGSLFDIPLEINGKPSIEGPGTKSSRQKLVSIDAKDVLEKRNFDSLINTGTIGGSFEKKGEVSIYQQDGITAFNFKKGALVLNQPVPKSLEWNGAFTVATWVKNPEISKEGECLLSWCDRFEFNLANSYNALHYNSGNYGAAAHLDGHFDMKYNALPPANEWHHIVLTFDGVVEKMYVNGKLDNSQVMVLASQIKNAKLRIGASDVGEHYSGYLASLEMYDYALNEADIQKLMMETSPVRDN